MKLIDMKYMRGQVTVVAAIVGAIGMIGASFFTSYATANNRTASLERDISVVEERENNHFIEVNRRLERIESKLDIILSHGE